MPGCDRISKLPESLITQILLHLPTKDSVKTSVLSTRWKNLWLNVPGLDLNSLDFPFEEDVFINFIDRFLEFKPESRLQIFKVNYTSYAVDGIKDRIGTAVNRGIQQLELESNTYYRDDVNGLIYPCIDFMPLNLYTSKTLVSLKLSFSGPEDPGFVSLPCLKIMHLREVRWHSSGTMNLEKLVSGCPVLEELILLRDPDDELVDTRVRSRSLKSFCVQLGDGVFCRSAHTLEIDAPGLEYMSLEEDQFDRIVVKNLTSILMVDLDIKFAVEFGVSFDPEDLSKRNEIHDFLTEISTVRHMIISQETMKVFVYTTINWSFLIGNLSQAFFFPILLVAGP